MRNGMFAQEMLSLATSRERAESIAGDLAEEGRGRGRLWFAAAAGSVALALFFNAFGTARGQTLRWLGIGLGLWIGIYTLVRIAGASLGVEPMPVGQTALTAMPVTTQLYLGCTLLVSSFVAGLVLGCGSTRNGLNPAAPLGAFFLSFAVAGPLVDVAAGTPTWYCTVLYLCGVPMLYALPLLLGAALSARLTAARRQALRQ